MDSPKKKPSTATACHCERTGRTCDQALEVAARAGQLVRGEKHSGRLLGNGSFGFVEKSAMLEANRWRDTAFDPVGDALRGVRLRQAQALGKGRGAAEVADDFGVKSRVVRVHAANYTRCLNACQQSDEDNMEVHPSTQRLFDALAIVAKVDGHEEPGKVALLLGESAATITNWKTRGVSKAGALKVAEKFQINPVWLRTGEGHMRQAVTTIPNMWDAAASNSFGLLVGLNKKVPRLAAHEVQGFVHGMFIPTEDRFEVVASPDVTPRCFMLEMGGDAMEAPSHADSIPQGSMLICDPDRDPKPGDIVVATHPRTGEPVIRQLIKEGGLWYLKAAKSSYPMIEVDGPSVAVAVAIEVTTRRRLLKGST